MHGKRQEPGLTESSLRYVLQLSGTSVLFSHPEFPRSSLAHVGGQQLLTMVTLCLLIRQAYSICLEEGVATHSSIFAWRIPLDRGSRWASVHEIKRVVQDRAAKQSTFFCDLLFHLILGLGVIHIDSRDIEHLFLLLCSILL